MNSGSMWGISSAIVVDDAFGPPTRGAIQADDKDKWIEHVSRTEDAQQHLFTAFRETGLENLEDLLVELTSNHKHITTLWDHYNNKTLDAVGLHILFETFSLLWTGKAEKPLLVCNALEQFVGPGKVQKFWRMEDAVNAMAEVDVAFIDFFLDDNEKDDGALQRIRNHKDHLAKAKLLFFMSSRASLETQHRVRQIVGTRAAFFEVMSKAQIDMAWVVAKLNFKRSSYLGNKSLENVVHVLVDAARQAAKEFDSQFEKVEIHDLRLLDLARLAAEGESVAAYLTWLASESIAAKIRRISGAKIKSTTIDPAEIGFSGQVKQGKVLFDLFSEVVFGPAHAAAEIIHFGEVLTPKPPRRRISRSAYIKDRTSFRSSSHAVAGAGIRRVGRSTWLAGGDSGVTTLPARVFAPNTFLLVLTPACDLVRCSPTKNVLCVVGTARDFSDVRNQAKEKLYGKHAEGLRHLLRVDEPRSPVLITWNKDQTLTLTVRELLSGNFKRVAQMNELYAQEVKEEVLRELGRVGTPIDPPPIFAMRATLRWRSANNRPWSEAKVGEGSFHSAILSYSEQPKESATVVLSEDFKKWVDTQITLGLNGQAIPQKLQNCLDSLKKSNQFILRGNFVAKENELVVRVASDENGANMNGVMLDVALSPEIL